MENKEWQRCTDECYPEDIDGNSVVIIAYYIEDDKIWCYWTYETCPYEWNVLSKSIAYWTQIKKPL